MKQLVCKNCKQEFPSLRKKKFCKNECAVIYNNGRLLYVSNLLTDEQRQYICEIQEKFLMENKLNRLN